MPLVAFVHTPLELILLGTSAMFDGMIIDAQMDSQIEAMIRMKDMEMRKSLVSLAVNFLLSWLVLPLFIPPFRTYSFIELVEAFFWQVVGMIGWPIGLLGGCAEILMQGTLAELGTLAMMLIYPGMLILIIRAFRVKRFRRWEWILLHILLTFSFVVIWHQILNGYDFMVG